MSCVPFSRTRVDNNHKNRKTPLGHLHTTHERRPDAQATPISARKILNKKVVVKSFE
jgi:hypothetical protein